MTKVEDTARPSDHNMVLSTWSWRSSDTTKINTLRGAAWGTSQRVCSSSDATAFADPRHYAGGMHLLPTPGSVVASGGEPFVPDADLAISGSPEQAAIIRRLLSPGTGLDLPVSADGRLIIIEDPALAPEAYRLEVTADRIMITAGDPAGVNWAGQTLRQLLPPSVLRAAPDGRPLSVPAVTITDEPRFGWRGIHLDVARHFLPLPELFHLVDLLALHKLNRLHLHLSDDQGWRFECRSHPRLHEVGGWRTETRRPADDHGDGTPHGGFYTQDQLRSLVAYAGQRGRADRPGT